MTHARGQGRKGWLAAYRDAVLFKTIYAWGLRRHETTMLDVVDWSANGHAPEFGGYGALSVRYGKATKGSTPRRRSVLTTMRWASEAVAEWVSADVRSAPGMWMLVWRCGRRNCVGGSSRRR